MITYHQGNIWRSQAERIVIPVNCVGIPGKGLAYQWAHIAALEEIADYQRFCTDGAFQPGDIWVPPASAHILVTTKNHWRKDSRYAWIAQICALLHQWGTDEDARRQHPTYDRPLLAIPPIGCGLGGLEWPTVLNLFQSYFNQVEFPVEIWVPIWVP
jgi:hypothetical protein